MRTGTFLAEKTADPLKAHRRTEVSQWPNPTMRPGRRNVEGKSTLVAELVIAQAVMSANVHIPLDWERDVKDSLPVSIASTDTIVGGCLDRAAKRAFLVVTRNAEGSRLIIRDRERQLDISLPEGMWTTLPYNVAGQYRFAYQKEAVRTNSTPIMFKLDDPHVEEVHINIQTRELEPSRSFESMDALSASFDPKRSADRALYELMMKHLAGAPVWDVHLLNSAEKTYIATLPTLNDPLVYNADFTIVWDVGLFPRLTGETSAVLRIVMPDAKKFGDAPEVVTGAVTSEWSAFTIRSKTKQSTYGSYASRLLSGKLDTKYLGDNILVLPQIRSLKLG